MRKRQQQKLKDDYLLTTGQPIESQEINKIIQSQSSNGGNNKLQTNDKNKKVLDNSIAIRSNLVQNNMKINWNNCSNIEIRIQDGIPNRQICYLVGPAYNKHGIMCNGRHVLSSSNNPYSSYSQTNELNSRSIASKPFKSINTNSNSNSNSVMTVSAATTVSNKEKLYTYLKRLRNVIIRDNSNELKEKSIYVTHPMYLELLTKVTEEVYLYKYNCLVDLID